MVIRAFLQINAAGALLYLRSLGAPGWLSGLALLMAVVDLVTVPFLFAALKQRVREIEKGELEEAKRY